MEKNEFLAKARRDPVWLANKLWPKNPLWSKQQDILRAVFANDRVTVRAANGVGKSHVAGRIIVCFALAYPGCEIVTTATTWDQVEKVLWKEIRDAHQGASFALGGKLLDTEWKLNDNGWMAYGMSTNKRERFLGHHSNPILVVMDEASGVPEMIDEATRSLITSEGSKLLKIGNPIDPSGHFYNSFNSDLFAKFNISVFDTPNFTAFGITREDLTSGKWQEKITGPLPFPQLPAPKWAADQIKEYGIDSPWVTCFIDGNFPGQSADSLISLTWIEACYKPVANTNRRAVGIDVARFGDDETVFALYDQGKISILESYRGQDLMTTCGKAKQYADKYQCQIGVDDTGLGGGVTDRLIELFTKDKDTKASVFAFVAGERPIKYGRAANKTTEAWWYLREDIRECKVEMPKDGELTGQLTGRKYKIESDGQIRLEGKRDIKDRGGKSPDKADAVAIANYVAKWGQPVVDKPAQEVSIIDQMRNKGLKMTQGSRL